MKDKSTSRVKLGGAITTVSEMPKESSGTPEMPACAASLYTLTPQERMCMIALRNAIAEAEQRFRGALTMLATMHELPGAVSLNAEMTDLISTGA